MNLISRKLLIFSATLFFSMAMAPVAFGQAGASEAGETCSCTCADYLDEKGMPLCQAQCDSGWEERQCAASAMPEIGDKDAETLRFEAELQDLSKQSRYETADNVIASQVYVFSISSPELRQGLWEDLENARLALAEQDQADADDAESLQNMPTDDLDAETLRYKAAVEQLNLPPGMVEDLVEMFQANDAEFRKTLWQRVEESPLKQ
jgi:hypothetical protein